MSFSALDGTVERNEFLCLDFFGFYKEAPKAMYIEKFSVHYTVQGKIEYLYSYVLQYVWETVHSTNKILQSKPVQRTIII